MDRNNLSLKKRDVVERTEKADCVYVCVRSSPNSGGMETLSPSMRTRVTSPSAITAGGDIPSDC
jgi:hypothetical protein